MYYTTHSHIPPIYFRINLLYFSYIFTNKQHKKAPKTKINRRKNNEKDKNWYLKTPTMVNFISLLVHLYNKIGQNILNMRGINIRALYR